MMNSYRNIVYFCLVYFALVEGRSSFQDLPHGNQKLGKPKAGPKDASCGTHQLDPETSGYTFKTPILQIGFNPSGYECTWRFLGTNGCTPVTTCESFKLGQSNECTSDFLDLSDGMGSGEKFCGSNSPANVSSPGTIMQAYLKLGYLSRDRKFQCTVTCASTDTPTTHVLPSQEPETTDCTCGEPGPVVEGTETYKDDHRIVNGEQAPKGFWRWQAGMVFRRGKSPFCGGSLINDRFVLTAAHCVVTTGLISWPGAAEVILNEYNFTDASETQLIRRGIIAITAHPFYNANTQDYDVAVLELDKPVDMNTSEEPIVRPVCLPPRRHLETYAGENATVIGWGATTEGGDQSEVVMQVHVPVITNEECNQQYENKITGRMICAAYPEGGRDSCQGDSGGPFMLQGSDGRYTEIGVVSWGEGCARPGKPGVYARVTEVNDWIRMTARRGTYCQES